jgi:hypothetical protein
MLLLSLIFGSALWMGCGGKIAIRYYMLEPMHPSEKDVTFCPDQGDKILVGVGPVTIAEYLQRTEMVIRNHRRQLTLTDDHQWAEPLEASVMRVMTTNLSHLLKPRGMTVLSWRDMSTLDYQIQLNLIRLDSEHAGSAVLEARWMLLKGKEREVVCIHTSRLKEKLPFIPDETGDYRAIVATESRLLEALSREMVDSLQYWVADFNKNK